MTHPAPPPCPAYGHPPRRVLVTGFGPFPGMPSNPSGRLARRLGHLARPALADLDIVVRVLPTTWKAIADAPRLLAEVRPDAVLMLGVAGRRTRVCVETRALNRAADAPDATRRHPPGRRLVADAPPLLTTTADALLLTQALHPVPSALSRDAGRYLCNALFFRMLWALKANPAPVPAVFVHIPAMPRLGRAAHEANLTSAVGNLLVRLMQQSRRITPRGTDLP
ncbi:hypothetical protein [Azorhizobium doebereinerae]|uniref:pyroglutamyl-peptidase I family protein n=1 Tax=Azorhizobium doebereinerae TaxID=281091 RepID=UPI00068776D2|nr:hypothetical protein [Azorhizobium doebereinerae]